MLIGDDDDGGLAEELEIEAQAEQRLAALEAERLRRQEEEAAGRLRLQRKAEEAAAAGATTLPARQPPEKRVPAYLRGTVASGHKVRVTSNQSSSSSSSSNRASSPR